MLENGSLFDTAIEEMFITKRPLNVHVFLFVFVYVCDYGCVVGCVDTVYVPLVQHF